MGTKMKGLLKGLRYISQIFDDEKEQEIQIGYPTEVKHVAHIGWDGPSMDTPSWMNEFKSPSGFQSAPLGIIGDPKENPEVTWVSEDSKSSRAADSASGDIPELPRSSRHHCSPVDKSDSPKKEASRRHSRRNQPKESGDQSLKSTRQQSDSTSTAGLESPSTSVPDIPKKSRRKKSKENVSGGSSSKSSRSKDTTGSLKPGKDEASLNSSSKIHSTIQEEGFGCSGVS